MISLELNLNHICHYNFLNVTSFDFLGDSIVEAVNSGMKHGDQQVNTNMTINTSASTQIDIVQNQMKKKNWYVTSLMSISI